MFKCFSVVCCVALLPVSMLGQELPARAFSNVDVHFANGKVEKSTSIVWRDGVIESVGKQIPFDAFVIDGGDSLHVYPGLLSGVSIWGSPDKKSLREKPARPGEPGYERAGIEPQLRPVDELKDESKEYETARKHGFTFFGAALAGRFFPGQIDLMTLASDRDAAVYDVGTGLLVQWEGAPGVYPAVPLGLIAKFRQLMYDAQALKEHISLYEKDPNKIQTPVRDKVLEAFFPVLDRQKTLYWVVEEPQHIDWVLNLKKEFGFHVVFVGGAQAYKRAEVLAKEGISVLATLDLPDKAKWMGKKDKDEEETESISEEEAAYRKKLKETFDAHVANIKTLRSAGVSVGFAALATEPKDFEKSIKVMLEQGYSADDLILLMTQLTADILGQGAALGDLRIGRQAHMSVFTKPALSEGAQVLYSVIGDDFHKFDVKPKKKAKEEKDDKGVK